jgi:predicted ATPase
MSAERRSVKGTNDELFLTQVTRRSGAQDASLFPWSLPLVRNFTRLRFRSRVTFFVGENGSGKSTLLEALAVAADALALGGADLRTDPTLEGARRFAASLVLSKSKRPRAKMFLRAEDVFGYTQRLVRDMDEITDTANRYAGTRAYGYIAAQRNALTKRYGVDPDGRSHGETFLALLEARLLPGGLYLLDEPETPLSPVRVLGLLAMLLDATAAGSQFVIATHSPILMALPGAALMHFVDGEIRGIAYEDVEHVRVTRDFLNAPDRYLKYLTESREGEGE